MIPAIAATAPTFEKYRSDGVDSAGAMLQKTLAHNIMGGGHSIAWKRYIHCILHALRN